MDLGVFIGVDLGTSLRRKSTGLAYLVENHHKPWIEHLPVHIISDDTLIHSSIAEIGTLFTTVCVGIDAPLSKPDHGAMRECEKRLRKHGIPCYPSGAQWIRQWVNKGIALKQWAEREIGARVIEVYPYAARRTLGIGAQVKKKTREGRQVIQDGLVTLIGGLNEFTEDRLLSDDELDAILSAYTAYCVKKGTGYKMEGRDGALYFPLPSHNHVIDEYY